VAHRVFLYHTVEEANGLPKLVVVGSNPIARSNPFTSLDLKPRQAMCGSHHRHRILKSATLDSKKG